MDALEAPRTVLRVTARLYQRISAQIILILGFSGLVYFLTYFLLNSGFAVRIFDEAVNSQFRGRIAWTRLSWGPLPWQLSILEPVLADSKNQPVITARRITVKDIQLLDLFGGRIAASDIVIESPVVRLVESLYAADPDPDAPRRAGPAILMNIEEMFLPPIGEGTASDGAVTSPVVLDFSNARIVDARYEMELVDRNLLEDPKVLDGLDARALANAPRQMRLVATGIEAWQGRFGLVTGRGGESMTIGAARAQVTTARMELAQGQMEAWLRAKAGLADKDPTDTTPLEFVLESATVNHFDWVGETFTVHALHGRTRGDPIRVASFGMDLDTPGSPAMRAEVSLTSDGIEKHLGPLGVSGITGPVQLSGRGSGELDSYDARVTAHGPGLELFDHRVGAWRLAARLVEGEVAYVDTLSAQAYGGSIDVDASYNLDTADATAWVGVDGVDLGRLPAVAAQPNIRRLARGPVRGRVRMHATSLLSQRRHVSATVDLTHRRTGAEVPGLARTSELSLIAALDDGQVSIHRLRAEAGRDRVSVRGALDLATNEANLTGSADIRSLAELGQALDIPLAGSVSTSFSVNGPLSNPRGRATLQADRVRYGDYPAADVRGELRYSDQVVRVADLDIRTDVGTVHADGTINLRGGPDLDLAVRVGRVNVSELPLDLDLDGQLRSVGTVRVKGSVRRPRVDGKIEWDAPRYANLSGKKLTIDGSWSGDTVRVESLVLDGPGSASVQASGTYDLRRKAFDGDVKVETLPLALANQFLETPLDLGGVVSLDLKGDGSIEAPRLNGDIQLDGVRYQGLELGDSKISLSTTDGRVSVTGELLGALTVLGDLPAAPGGAPGKVAVTFKTLDPASLLPRLRDPAWSATTTGAVVATVAPFEGRLDAVEVAITQLDFGWRLFDARQEVVRLPGGRGGDASVGVRVARPIRLSFRHDVLTVDDFALEVNGQPLGMAGTVGIDGSLDLAVGGTADLALLQPFLRSLFTDMAGAAQLQVSLIGPLDDPQASGWVRLESAEVVPRSSVIGSDLRLDGPVEFEIISPAGPRRMLPGADAPSRGVFTVILPDQTRARPGQPSQANRFALRRDDTVLRVEQFGVELENFQLERLVVGLDADELTLNVPQVMRGTVILRDVIVDLFQHRTAGRAPERRLLVSGDIEIQQARYVADISPPGEINQGVADNFTGRSRARTVSIFERVPLLKRLMLDVRLHGDDGIFVENKIAVLALALELEVDVRAKGFLVGEADDASEDLLQLDGRVGIIDGSRIIYQRRPFEVAPGGGVRFSPSYFMQADLSASSTFRLRTDAGQAASSFDLGATADVREEEVTLELSVSMPTRESEPRIDPVLTSSSGASQIEVLTLLLTGRFPSDLTGAAGAQPATEALLSPVLSLIEAPLEETLDLDLSLTPLASGSLFVDVDKVLSRRLRLYSRTPVGDEAATNPQIFGLQYRLNNLTSGELTTEQLGNTRATSGRLRLQWDLQ